MWGNEDLLDNDNEMIEDFMRWAFGKEFEYIDSFDAPDEWNELHEDLFKCSIMGSLRDDLKTMIKFWRESDGN